MGMSDNLFAMLDALEHELPPTEAQLRSSFAVTFTGGRDADVHFKRRRRGFSSR